MQPDGGGGRFETRHVLGQQTACDAGENVAGARGREPGRRVRVDRKPAVRRGDDRVRPLQHHDGTGALCRRLRALWAGPIGEIREKPGKLSLVRGQDRRRHPRRDGPEEAVGAVPQGQGIGIEHQRRCSGQRDLHEGARLRVAAEGGSDRNGAEPGPGDQRGKRGGVVGTGEHHGGQVGCIDREG